MCMAVQRCRVSRLSEREGLWREGSGKGKLCIRVTVSWEPLKLRLSYPDGPVELCFSLPSLPPLSFNFSFFLLHPPEIYCPLPPLFPPSLFPNTGMHTPIPFQCSLPPSLFYAFLKDELFRPFLLPSLSLDRGVGILSTHSSPHTHKRSLPYH